MPLIEGNFLERFEQLASQAERIDVAVAWARRCKALEVLAKSDVEIRIVIGLSGNVTCPNALCRMAEFAKLRVVPDKPGRIFHPKYFCFHGEKTICWVGSVNLTHSAFEGNDELIHEFDDSAREDLNWFESLWDALDCEPGPLIDDYKERYEEARWEPPPSGGTSEFVPLRNQSTWDDFVRGLQACDYLCRSQKLTDDGGVPWDIWGDQHSYLHTISTGQKVAQLPDWRNLKQDECDILRGVDRKEGTWALLGDLKRGAAYVFNFDHSHTPRVNRIRMQIREQVRRVLCASPSEIAAVAHDAMETIRKLRHKKKAYRPIGPAAATRLLTLARPDYLVSVNGASKAGLGALSGLKSPADNYRELLNWVYDQPWFKAPEPAVPRERELWKSRAALLDAFVYDGIHGKLQPTR